MSTMPPGPRFRSPAAAVSSSRGRMWRISSASLRRQRWPKAARWTAAVGGADRAAEPYTARALHNACRSQSWPGPFGEVAGELGQRRGQRAALAGGAQPGVHLVEPAVGAQAAGGLDDPLPQLAEEVLVGGALAAALAEVEGRLAVGLVEEDDVQVAVVVHFPAAELAQGQDRPFRRARRRAARRRSAAGRTWPPAAGIRRRRSAPGRPRRCRTAPRWWPGRPPCPAGRGRPREAAGRS